MDRRTLLLTPLAALLAPSARAQVQPAPLTAQDQADLARVQAYLNSIHTLKARFLQVAPTGQVSEGTAWVDRPGRMRFEYANAPFVLIAGHGILVFRDKQLNQTSNLPLGSTPLGILLAPTVQLVGGDVTIVRIDRQPGQLQLTVVRTASPGDGSLTLVFSDNPLALRQWIVVDAQHKETRVSLYDVQLGGSFSDELFNVARPEQEPPSIR